LASAKISALTAGAPAQTGDLFPIDRSGSNFSVSASDIANLASVTSIAANGGLMPVTNGGMAQSVVASQDYYFLPIGLAVLASSTSSAAMTANQVFLLQFTLDRVVTFTRMSIYVVTTSSTNHEYIGIYSGGGSSLLVQASFTLTASTGAMTATVSSTTLNPGNYWLARSADNSTSVLLGTAATSANPITLFNGGSIVRIGLSSNSTSSGTLPSSIGTVSGQAWNAPLVLLEP